MNHRKLAFFSLFAALSFIASNIPLLGPGMGFGLGALIWAVAGFRYWLLSLPMLVLVDSVNAIQGIVITGALGQEAVATISTLPAWAQFVAVASELALLVAFPLMIWLLKRDLRKMLVKRLGRSYLL